MNIHRENKKKKQEVEITTSVIIHLLEYIHPYLHCLISKELNSYCGTIYEKLPVSLLLSLHSIATLKSFEKILLCYKFKYGSFIRLVASWGNFETIKWFHSNSCCSIFLFLDDVMPIILRKGDTTTAMKCVEFFYYENYDQYEEAAKTTLEVAAKYGQIKILQAAVAFKRFDWMECSEELIDKAAIGGHVEILQWIWDKWPNDFKKYFIEENTFALIENAVDANHMHVLEWINSQFQLEIYTPDPEDSPDQSCAEIMKSAARNGNINIVRWLWSKKILDNTDRYCTEAAAEGGNLAVLQYLRELGYPWSRNLCLTAVVNGNLEVLKWAYLNDCPWNDSKMFPAAASSKRPSVDLYQFLFDKGCPLVEEKSFKKAGKIGNFEFIQFAQSKGSTEYDQWQNKWMIQGAIRTGRLDALEWSLGQFAEKGLVLDKYRTDEQWIDRRLKYCWTCWAAEHGHVHILEFLRVWFGDEFWIPALFRKRHDTPDDLQTFGTCDIVNKVAKLGHVKVLDWIAKYTSDWDKSTVFTTAIKTKNIKVLIWLKSQSTDDTSSHTWFGSISNVCPHPSDLAFTVDDFEIFRWIHNHGCPWNDATDWVHLLRHRSGPSEIEVFYFAADEVRFELQKIDSSRLWKQGYPSRWRRLSGRRSGPPEEGGRTGERFEDDDEEEENEEEEEEVGGGEEDEEHEEDEDDEDDEEDDEDMEDEEEGEGEEEESE